MSGAKNLLLLSVAATLEASILDACRPQNAWTVNKAPTRPFIQSRERLHEWK